MSPRSTEFLAKARSRLAAARDSLAAGHPDETVSLSAYAMLYAARAALSEEDRHSKTHTGVWGQFAEVFVRPGRFDVSLYRAARDVEEARLRGDYEAASFEDERASDALDVAARFTEAVVKTVHE